MFESNYRIRGKHATYIRYLTATTVRLDSTAKSAGVVSRAVDIYTFAPLIGIAYNLKSNEDVTSDDTYNLYAEQVLKVQDELDFAYRLVMLADNTGSLTDDQKIERAFKQDEDLEKTKINMDLFNSYFRGGLEWLYYNFTEDATTKEDYLEKVQAVAEMFKDDCDITC